MDLQMLNHNIPIKIKLMTADFICFMIMNLVGCKFVLTTEKYQNNLFTDTILWRLLIFKKYFKRSDFYKSIV